MGYVNAGMLEPIMTIASEDELTIRGLIINFCQLIGLFSWLYLLSDAFDITDTQQNLIYWDRICEQGKKKAKDLPEWLTIKKAGNTDDAVALNGSLSRDISLWFMLACSMSAFFGVTTHRDVIHSRAPVNSPVTPSAPRAARHVLTSACVPPLADAVVILWALLHHQSRLATAWRGTGYFHTFFSPSAALLPLEYCLNLTDQEMIGDEDGVADLEKVCLFEPERMRRCASPPQPSRLLPTLSVSLRRGLCYPPSLPSRTPSLRRFPIWQWRQYIKSESGVSLKIKA